MLLSKEIIRSPLPCSDWLDCGLIMDPANRAPRVETRKRKTFVFKTSSREVMSSGKTDIRQDSVTFTICAPRTDATANIIRKRATEADERYNIKVTGNAKSEDHDLQETSAAFSRVAAG